MAVEVAELPRSKRPLFGREPCVHAWTRAERLRPYQRKMELAVTLLSSAAARSVVVSLAPGEAQGLFTCAWFQVV
jgi:hypothetical protein